ncbi:unnamed protein product [Parajaminaea phylloscopi]
MTSERAKSPSTAPVEVRAESDDAYGSDFELDDEEREQHRIQEQRRKRQQLIARYQQQEQEAAAASSHVASDTPSHSASVRPSISTGGGTPATAHTAESSAPSPQLDSVEYPRIFSLSKTSTSADAPSEGPKGAVYAADYDPHMDSHVGPQPQQETSSDHFDGDADHTDSEYEEVEVEAEEDFDDMFAVDDSTAKQTKRVRVKKDRRVSDKANQTAAAHNNLNDNWDDSEGYYRIVLGERIGPQSRYHIFANLGKGMFSEVVRAKDLGEDGSTAGEVAIKIVRSQESMYKAGLKEIAVLNRLADMDPDDRRHIVRLKTHFQHRGHLCMVFESLSMNLREVVKRFGKDVGLNLRAVRAYTYQIFLGLALLKKASIVHADLKPDNVIVNEVKTVLKICDLGSASDLSNMVITPYLVSRFYRAPEVILGQAVDCSIDVWSIGCTLYELYTGKILFPGRSSNQMLLLIQELKGKFTAKQIRKGQFSSTHFDESNVFLSRELDKSTGVEVTRRVPELSSTPVSDLRSRLLGPAVVRQLSEEELRLTQHFVDLLSRCLELDPAKRIIPADALKHPFLT